MADMKEFPDGMIERLNCTSGHWRVRMGQYDGHIEVSPVIVLDANNIPNPNAYETDGSTCEVTDDATQAHFWSAYLHMYGGGVDCIGDFTRYEDALKYAIESAHAVNDAMHHLRLSQSDVLTIIDCLERRREDVHEMAKYGDYTEEEETKIDAELEELLTRIRAQEESHG